MCFKSADCVSVIIYSDIKNRNKPEETRSPQLHTHIRVFSGWLFLTASYSCFPCRMVFSCPCWRNISFPTQTIWITWDQAMKQALQTNRGGSPRGHDPCSTYHTCNNWFSTVLMLESHMRKPERWTDGKRFHSGQLYNIHSFTIENYFNDLQKQRQLHICIMNIEKRTRNDKQTGSINMWGKTHNIHHNLP